MIRRHFSGNKKEHVRLKEDQFVVIDRAGQEGDD